MPVLQLQMLIVLLLAAEQLQAPTKHELGKSDSAKQHDLPAMVPPVELHSSARLAPASEAELPPAPELPPVPDCPPGPVWPM